jgi:hypothetical protein
MAVDRGLGVVDGNVTNGKPFEDVRKRSSITIYDTYCWFPTQIPYFPVI